MVRNLVTMKVQSYVIRCLPMGEVDRFYEHVGGLEGEESEVVKFPCMLSPDYFGTIPFFDEGDRPWLDLPAVVFSWRQDFQFYEDDGLTSLTKIEWRDNTGIHFGRSSVNRSSVDAVEEAPVAIAARTQLPIRFNSFPEGASLTNQFSDIANSTVTLAEMQGTSLTHAFGGESLKFLYQKWNVFQSSGEFFDHEVAAFFRFDKKKKIEKDVKSCQPVECILG